MPLPKKRLDVSLFVMRNILFLIVALAFFSASFVSAAHAHVNEQGSNQQLELSADQDSADNNNVAGPLCDMHCHNHIAPADFTQDTLPKAVNKLFASLSESPISFFIYGLKRPPKT